MFPIPIESAIMAHPQVKAALVLGNEKHRPILLVELSVEFAELEHKSQAQEWLK